MLNKNAQIKKKQIAFSYFNNFIYLFLFFFCCQISSSFGQTTSKKAHKLYNEARTAQQKREFRKAIMLLKKAIQIDGNYTDAYADLGNIYMLLREFDVALKFHQKIIDLQPNSKKSMLPYFYAANHKLIEGNYHKALDYSEKFLRFKPEIRSYKRQINIAKTIIERSEFALKGIQNPVDFNPTLLDSALSIFKQQYFPVLTADQKTLIFTARSEGGDENIYQTQLKKDGTWEAPTPIEELNTESNEGTCSISADGKTIIFTVCKGADGRNVYGACDLFISKKSAGKWSNPKNMGRGVNTSYWESQPALSADGRMLLFVSDRPGGIGKKDIWVSHRDKNGIWERAINMGKIINTTGDEVSPFLHVNGKTLFFASNERLGYGGFDLFKSKLAENEWQWQEPVNLGYPINTHQDQVALFITSDGEKAYYSNEITEDGEIMSSYINVFSLPKEIKIEKVSNFVQGIIYDEVTKKPINAQIDLVDLATDEIVSSVFSDEKYGDYLIVLTDGAQYGLYVNKENYLFESVFFDYQNDDKKQNLVLNVFLKPIKKGTKITLHNIFFESGSFELLEKSKTELNKLAQFLTKNKNIKIEVSGHTDNVGNAAFNQKLSLNRAESVNEYLRNAGISTSRIIAKGYGEIQNIASNNTKKDRASNRRIEFKIIE